MDFNKLERVFRDLALQAGARIMEIYSSESFDVRVKSDQSPVTEADEAADSIISAGLREAFPDITLVTEEQSASHDLTAGTFLIVDPLGESLLILRMCSKRCFIGCLSQVIQRR